MITVFVKLVGSLLSRAPANQSGRMEISLKDGSTVRDAVEGLRIPADRVKLVLVNHAGAGLNQCVKEGDMVSLFPQEYPVFADWKGAILEKRDPAGEPITEGEMKRWKCSICDYVYDPSQGDPDHGIKAGTSFEDIPDDWVCPTCGTGKDMFEPE